MQAVCILAALNKTEMKEDLDISNIESKPTVVVVSNQIEYDQLMRHLEKEGKIWGNMKRPTEWQPEGFDFPYCIFVDRVKLTWSGAVSTNENKIIFRKYAAKHMKPKRPYPNRVVKSKYDALLFDLKMAQTALDNRNKDVDGWVKKINELVAERDELKAANQDKAKRLEEIAGVAFQYKAEADQLTQERDRLEKENIELRRDNDVWREAGRKTEEQKKQAIALLESKAAEHAHLATLARKLRDQRDTARFMAALFALCALGFAVAVWIGKLQPVVNVD